MRSCFAALCFTLLAGCAAKEDVLEAEVQRQHECDEMREELNDARDNPLIHATLQENYNRQCIDVYPGPP